MNPQPEPYIGNIFAFIFVCMIMFYTIKSYNGIGKKIQTDLFILGYLLDNNDKDRGQIKCLPKESSPPPSNGGTKPKNPPPDDPRDPPSDDSPKKPKSPRPAKTINKKPKAQYTIHEADQLYLDCIDALYALGMKKSEAKKTTKTVFSSTYNRPNSVQDFLMIALRRN